MTKDQDHLVYVDSLDAVRVGVGRFPESRFVTDNPVLARLPGLPVVVEDASANLDQLEASRVGEACVDALLEIDRVLTAAGAGRRYAGIDEPLNLTPIVRSLPSSLCHRGIMLERSLRSDTASVTLMSVDQPRWETDMPWVLPRFANPHRPLAEEGFFGDYPVSFISVETKLPTDTPDGVLKNIILRASLVPPSMLAHLFLGKLLSRGGRRDGIAVGRTPETIREALFWLALMGFKLPRFNTPGFVSLQPPGFDEVVPEDSWVSEHVRPIFCKHLRSTGILADHQIVAIVRLIVQHVSAGMNCLEQTKEVVREALRAAFPDGETPGVLLTGGHYGPLGALLKATARAEGVKILGVEHGATTGISGSSERRIPTSEVATCDVLLAASDASARSFGAGVKDGMPRIECVGLASQTRQMFWPRIQRYFARRALNLRRGEIAVMHVSGYLIGGNLRPGDDGPVESFIVGTDKRFLTEIYGKVSKTILFKSYPTHRYPFVADYDTVFDLPNNLRMVDWADFRYFRAAADIIVTNSNQSTLGWCVGAGVPLIHLTSRHTLALLDDGLRARFSDAFFAIDQDLDDWADRLVELLSRDIADLRREWRSKATARASLYEDCIVGPAGNVGRRVARTAFAELERLREPLLHT